MNTWENVQTHIWSEKLKQHWDCTYLSHEQNFVGEAIRKYPLSYIAGERQTGTQGESGIHQHLIELLCTSPSQPVPFWGLYVQQLIEHHLYLQNIRNHLSAGT